MEVIFPLNNFFFVARKVMDLSETSLCHHVVALMMMMRCEVAKRSRRMFRVYWAFCQFVCWDHSKCEPVHISPENITFFYSIEKITRTWSINSQLNSQTDVLVLFELYRKNQFLMVAGRRKKKNPPDWNDWSRIDNNYYPLFSLTFKDAREELRQQQMAWSISRRACT